ncbi:MAG: response regulator [Ectothiorhodospiraceae bacterium]|nr:response regulator [Ectothiorhodospiraceae bacterium]
MQDPAVLELLRAEVEESVVPLAEAFSVIITGADDSDGRAAAISQAVDQIDCIRAAAEAGGMPGLEIACERLRDNLSELPSLDEERLQQLDEPLMLWPERVMAYLMDPGDSATVAALANHFHEQAWPLPLGEHESSLLAELLAEAPGGNSAPTTERRQQASEDDVSLVPGDDVNLEVFTAFIDDAPQQAQELSQCLQALTASQNPAADLDRARRIAHTLKGAAAVGGVAGVANLTHHLEDLLEYLARSGSRPAPALMHSLLEAADCLETMIDALRGLDSPPEQAVSVLQSVLDWANRMDRGELETAAELAEPPSAQEKSPEPAAEPGVAASAQAETSLRVPVTTVDSLFRYAGELSVATAQLEARIAGLMNLQQAFTDQDRIVQQRLFELEDLVDIRDVTSAAGYQLHGNRADDDFDPLEMDEYNALHGCSRALGEAIADWRELRIVMHDELTALRSMISQQGRLHRSLENTVLATRLVPVNTVEGRLQRSVRQACRATGKQASLELHGGDLMMDTELLQGLMDPLGHLLRNAVDHGIEATDQRREAGKPEQGMIRIRVRRDGNTIELICEDDGRGLDLEAVRHRALERGLLEPDAMPDAHALARLVLLPGFSTRDTVTRVSGRGVGLDVVHERVREMKGTVDLHSENGKGSRFVLRLPAALVTVHVLLVEAGGQTVAIPSSDLIQAPIPGSGSLELAEDGTPGFVLADKRYPIQSLATMMGRAAPPTEPDVLPPVLLAHLDGETRALQVERMQGSASVVIKGFGVNLPRVRGVLGAAILGNGSVAPVLDLAGLQRTPASAGGEIELAPAELEAPSMGEVLVVDDSLSVRRSLTQFLQDSGYTVRQARDGIEAVRSIEEQIPDIMLVDLEMPRMNGLELTAHLRSREDTDALPIVMLTSRAMQKHRGQASSAGVSAYMTKPFQETELLDTIERLLAQNTPTHQAMA